jgi:hypothetical protein
MIEWIEYEGKQPDGYDSANTHLVTNGKRVIEAYIDYDPINGTQWWSCDTDDRLIGITHYAFINLPGEDKADGY